MKLRLLALAAFAWIASQPAFAGPPLPPIPEPTPEYCKGKCPAKCNPKVTKGVFNSQTYYCETPACWGGSVFKDGACVITEPAKCESPSILNKKTGKCESVPNCDAYQNHDQLKYDHDNARCVSMSFNLPPPKRVINPGGQ